MNTNKYFDTDNYKTWSNVTGYGNIEVNSLQKDHIKQLKTPWNRIPALTRPTITPIDPNNSWSPSLNTPVSKERISSLEKNCNLCKK